MKKFIQKVLGILIITILIIGFAFAVIWFTQKDIDEDSNGEDDKDEQAPPYEKVLLNSFPISLDILFYMDLPVERAQRLDNIENGQTGGSMPFLVPYPNLFHLDHAPAAAKWYLYVMRETQISIPVDCYLEIPSWYDVGSGTTKYIDGTLVQVNLPANFHLNYYIHINLAHIHINRTLVDDFYNNAEEIDSIREETKAIFIPANTIFGFTPDNMAFDLSIQDLYLSNYGTDKGQFMDVNYRMNPYFYFTENVQNELMSYYSAQYDAMKVSGKYVESRLNNTININEENSIFGTWYYDYGPFNLDDSHHDYWWYSFEGSILNLMNVNATDRETFYKDRNTDLPFTNDMIGVFGDSVSYDHPIDNYDNKGGRYMYLEQGNICEGIVRLDRFFWILTPFSLYMKYSLTIDSEDMYNDRLVVEYFDTLIEAQGPFTSNSITYERIWDQERIED
ncbi:MAG: hypothetical protein ACFFAN_07160 [Promethearchaeota archaeon]